MKITLITLAMLGISAPALAGTDASTKPSIDVRYDDLNLASEQGQKALAQRIEVAARRVCQLDRVVTGTRIRDREAERCYVAAKQQANIQFAAVVEQHSKGG